MDSVLIGIPTKDRPEHLSALLATIMFQSYENFDVLIVDTGEEWIAKKDSQVQNVVRGLRWNGHRVTFVEGCASGRSMVVPMNRLMIEAYDRKCDWFFKVDDDHVLPPHALTMLVQDAKLMEGNAVAPVVVSGVTPWLTNNEGDSAPALVDPATAPLPLTDIWIEDSFGQSLEHHQIRIGHFARFSRSALLRTKLLSPANFLMRPDCRLQWSDLHDRSLFSDVIWSLQLQAFLGYSFYFEVGVEVWHVAASTGGTRTNEDKTEAEMLRIRHIDSFLKEIGWGRPGIPPGVGAQNHVSEGIETRF